MASVQQIFEKINASLSADPTKVNGLEAVFQFNLSGEDEGVYQIILRKNEAAAHEGEKEVANCTLNMKAEDFKKLLAGKLNATMAFMTGKLKVSGDMGLAMKLPSVLSAYSK